MAAPTINFNAFLEKEKLKNNGSNFADWFRNLRIVLTAGNLTYVLDAPLGDPPAADAPDEVKNVYLARKNQYSIVQCAILYGLESELQKRFENHDPHDIVRELKMILRLTRQLRVMRLLKSSLTARWKRAAPSVSMCLRCLGTQINFKAWV